MNPLSFRTKLALTMGGLILAIVGFISFYFPRKLEREALRLVAHKAETLAHLTAFTINPAVYFHDPAALDEALSGARQDKDVAYVVVTDPSGRQLAAFHPELARTLQAVTAEGGISKDGDLYEVMTPIRDRGRELARLYVGMSLARLRREIMQTRITIGVISLVILGLGLAAVLLLSNLLTRPLRQVAASARRIAAGELDQYVPVDTTDEIGQLAGSFNDMAIKIAHRNASLQQSHDQLRSLSMRLLSIQEEERIRIAREVHDELGQALTALKIELQQLGHRHENLDDDLRALNRSVDAIIDRVRKISSELRPAILDDLGMAAALEQQLRRLRESTGIRTTLTISEEPQFDTLSSSTIFRIVQESLANVVRHAEATEVEVSLTVNSDQAELQVSDNGRGITPEQTQSPDSLGLIGIRERAEMLNGNVRVEGAPGRGTTVTVTLPLPRKT
jgi:signal transduction histidine kinase